MEWKVNLYDSPSRMGTEVFIFQEHGENITYIGKDFYEHTVGKGASIETGLILNKDQLIALTQALANKGFEPKKEYVSGKLEATESHLSDMRQLLKLK